LPEPCHLGGSFRLEIDFLTTAMAEAASLPPGVERTHSRGVAVAADDVETLSRYRGTLMTMAATALGI
jgi:D-aminopeptidase